ncbi:hypothetical protein GCM10007424_01160 [Flavobacterium suaedae]|uniref:Uncharacterized protein n=1 Tax=Flavobacterium suaedae TaxID=1767027 RepID=A0ABQ1JEA4_9FLAO|nr:hypothetical protein [Flavobacterium suaedae]GGB65022.1 hypothetical protein GCM10007424_01160 [Flavobacterium suaedae]
MTKQEFFNFYYNQLEDAVYLTESVDELKEEVSHNCWYISIPKELNSEITVDEISDLIKSIKEKYTKELKASGLNIGLWFYLWIDEQAGQLRFNFINSNHKELPFGCSIVTTDNIKFIISEYIEFPDKYKGFIDFSDLIDIDDDFSDSEYDPSKFVLTVYSEMITSS